MDEQKRFALLMAKLALGFTNADGVPKEKIALYWERLIESQRIPIDDLEAAINYLIDNRTEYGFPTVATIRDAATGTGDKDLAQRALAAWNEANESLVDGFHSDDPMTNEAIRMAFGSWERFGECKPDDESFDRNHFVKTYKEMAKRQANYPQLDEGEIRKQIAENRRLLAQVRPEQEEGR